MKPSVISSYDYDSLDEYISALLERNPGWTSYIQKAQTELANNSYGSDSATPWELEHELKRIIPDEFIILADRLRISMLREISGLFEKKSADFSYSIPCNIQYLPYFTQRVDDSMSGLDTMHQLNPTWLYENFVRCDLYKINQGFMSSKSCKLSYKNHIDIPISSLSTANLLIVLELAYAGMNR